MKKRKEGEGLKILWAKNEKEFYSLIEEKLEKQGFEVFETSTMLMRESDFIRFS